MENGYTKKHQYTMVLPWYYHGIPQFLDTNICKVYCKLSQYPRREPAFVSNPG